MSHPTTPPSRGKPNPSLRSFAAWLGLPSQKYLPGESFDPQSRFVTSYLLPPLALAVYRSAVTIYVAVALIYEYATGGARTFSYFTSLSYWGLLGYFAHSSIQTYSFWWSLRRHRQSGAAQYAKGREAGYGSHEATSTPRSWLDGSYPRALQFAHSLLWSTVACFPLLVTVVFWAILAPGGCALCNPSAAYSNISVHTLNLVFAGLEMLLMSRNPMLPWSHMLMCVVMLALYIGVAFITRAAQGFYTYDFLNVEENGSGYVGGVIVGIGVGACLSFCFGQLFIFVRELVAAKVSKGSSRTGNKWGSAAPAGVRDDELGPTLRGPGPEGEGGYR